MCEWLGGGRGGENPEYPEKTPDSQPEDQYIIIITGEKPLIVRIGSVWSEIAGFNQLSYRQIHLYLQTCWTVRLLPRGHVVSLQSVDVHCGHLPVAACHLLPNQHRQTLG